MKKIPIRIILAFSLLLISCDTTTYSHNNPLSYRSEIPLLQTTPYIPYSKILNRIDYGIIGEQGKPDSVYVRGTFYDNSKFRDIGNLYFNSYKVDEVKAEDLFDINQLVEGFFKFGVVYFMKLDTAITNQELAIWWTGNEIEPSNSKIEALKSKLIITNIQELTSVSKSKGFAIQTNDIGYAKARIKIYNSDDNFIFYTDFNDKLSLTPDKLSNIPQGEYYIECLKGNYVLDTLSNSELIIYNVYSSYTFKTNIN